MFTSPDRRLLEWIRKFRSDLTAEGTITRLELYHSIEGEMGERLVTIEMADRDEDEDPDDLAQEIWNEAEDDAETRSEGSHQRYVVRAFRGDTRAPDEAKSFVILGKMVSSLVGSGSEPPTARGEMMAGMRQTNDLHALVVRMTEQVAGSAALQLHREREYSTKLINDNYKLREQQEAMLDRRQERELARKREDDASEQTKVIWQGLGQLLPMVVMRLLAPQGPHAAALPLQPQQNPTDAQTQGPSSGTSAGTHGGSAPGPHGPRSPDPGGGGAPAGVGGGGGAPVSTGGGAPAAAVLQRDRIMAGLLGTITPQQIQELMGTFTSEQTEAFLGVYASFRESPPDSAAAPNGSDRSN